MKKVLCFLSILFFLKAQAFAILPNGIEKGDTIYRNLTLTSLEYHAGIYRYFMEGVERDALNENDHEIREQTPSGTRTNTLYNFKHEAPFRYARTKNLTVQQRNKIIEKAYSPDLVKPYIESSILPWISFWYATIEWDKDIDDKDNDDEVDPDEVQSIRCDGWVELVYAFAGVQIQGDIISHPEDYNECGALGRTLRSPKTQCFNMDDEAKGYPPNIKVYDSNNKLVPEGSITKDKNLIAVVDDGENGSGVCRFEVYQGKDITGIAQFDGWDTTYYDTQYHSYDLSYDKAHLPDGEICIRAFDQAGNSTLMNFAIGNSPQRKGELIFNNIRPAFTIELTDEDSGIDISTLKIILDGPGYPVGDYYDELTGILTWTPDFDLDEGYHAWKIIGFDNAGNAIEDDWHTFTVDVTDPLILISGISNGATYNTNVTPIISITDMNLDDSKTVIKLNDENYIPGTEIERSDFYTLTVQAEDLAGNKSNTMITFTIERPTDFVFAIQTSRPWISTTLNNPYVLQNYKNEAIQIINLLMSKQNNLLNGDKFYLTYFSNGAIGVDGHDHMTGWTIRTKSLNPRKKIHQRMFHLYVT